MSTTVGEASRKWRCRPLRITESKPASVSFARCALAVCGVIRAAEASSVAVRARPTDKGGHLLGPRGFPAQSGILAMKGPVIHAAPPRQGRRGKSTEPRTGRAVPDLNNRPGPWPSETILGRHAAL